MGLPLRRGHLRQALGLLAILLAAPGCAAQPAGDDGVPAGYRGPPYRAPTPPEVPGGTTLHFAEDVAALIAEEGVIPVNVTPVTLSPPLGGQRLWQLRPDKSYLQIPASTWLPNVGFQELAPEMLAYFRTNLQRLTGGARDRGLLFYCTAECWMSWNAARRARDLGYTRVYWYPLGIDGWLAEEQDAERGEPVAFTE